MSQNTSEAADPPDAIDIAKRHFPAATDDEIDAILWSCSPFPFGSLKGLDYILCDMACRASSPSHAIYHAHSEYERMWMAMGGPTTEEANELLRAGAVKE